MVKQTTGQKNPALRVALAGVLAALLSSGKFVLSFLPNVEIVTLLTALAGYVFGGAGIAAAVIFVLVEPLLYGMGTWVVSYLLYWPLVATVFFLARRAGIHRRVPVTLIAVALTVWFGVLTSLVDVLLVSALPIRFFTEDFFRRFAVLYARGVPFFAVQIGCNAVLFPLLFPLLASRGERLTRK